MAHQAEPVTRTLTQKTNPMAAAAKMPIQFSPLLLVWMKPKSVEVTQAACQKAAPGAFFMCSSKHGRSPTSANAYTPQTPLPLVVSAIYRQAAPTAASAHQKLMPRLKVNC